MIDESTIATVPLEPPRVTVNVVAPCGIPDTNHHCFNGCTANAVLPAATSGVPLPPSTASSALPPVTVSGRDDTTLTAKPFGFVVPAEPDLWLELEHAPATNASAQNSTTLPRRIGRP